MPASVNVKDKLVHLFRANAKAGGGLAIRAEDGSDEATVYVYDAIGSWYGIGAQEFVQQLAAITAKTIHLRINSPGGDVFEARAMQTALMQHPARVVAHIDGLAASAASYLALAGDEVEISEGGFIMIHNAWGLCVGNKHDMAAVGESLDKIDASIRADYARKTGKTDEELASLMDAETWLNAEEALEAGFVDRIFKPADKQNAKAAAKWDLSAYQRPPKALTEPAEPARNYDREQAERRLALIERLGR